MEQTRNTRYNNIRQFFETYLNINNDKTDYEATMENIRKGVEFKGANLWILICAIFIASLGLNVNSTAVIIGAMLISPLMGPIIGVGLSVGINDFSLMKKSLKSLLIATLFSVATATVYFVFTPLDEAQSELLARTSPTIYDVLIAFFGGAAGILALSIKDKGNVLPGVAIATALMPPLCTAGFGLATGNLLYFLGAFYLYFINSIFISLATYLGVKLMKYPKKHFIDKEREKTVKNYIVIIVILTMCPAVFMTFSIVKDTLHDNKISNFIENEMTFENSQIISKKVEYVNDTCEINLIYMGKEIPEYAIQEAQAKLPKYHLDKCRLVVQQGIDNGKISDLSTIKAMVVEDLYKNNEKRILEQSEQIKELEKEISEYKLLDNTTEKMAPELKILYPSAKNISIGNAVSVSTDSLKKDTTTIAIIKFSSKPSKTEIDKLTSWLKERTGAKDLKLIVE